MLQTHQEIFGIALFCVRSIGENTVSTIKPSETKYATLIEQVRKIHLDLDFNLFYSADEFGLNPYYPSKTGKVEFVFYWDSLEAIATPEGRITPLGSHSHSGNSQKKALEAMIETFGLKLVSQRDGGKGERWHTYEMTKDLP